MQEIITWGFRGLLTLLFIVLWFWTKRWVNQHDDRWVKHDKERDLEREAWAVAGGSAVSGFKTLQAWRDSIMDKGGAMLKNEHSILCKEITREVTDKFCDRVDEMFEHHREWVGQELKLLRMEITRNREE
jgi:hypothetical protein